MGVTVPTARWQGDCEYVSGKRVGQEFRYHCEIRPDGALEKLNPSSFASCDMREVVDKRSTPLSSSLTYCYNLHSEQSLSAATEFSGGRRVAILLALLAFALCVEPTYGGTVATGRSARSERMQQCRQGCFEKFATKEKLCQLSADCMACWNECMKLPPPKINKSIRETWSLHTVSMLPQDSLVLVDVVWAPLAAPSQCLVTWEVAGGGLMGNLLTESFSVQLSLWPNTKYRIQVTCKNKVSRVMSRSLPLIIDTADSAAAVTRGPMQPYAVTSPLPRTMDAGDSSGSKVAEMAADDEVRPPANDSGSHSADNSGGGGAMHPKLVDSWRPTLGDENYDDVDATVNTVERMPAPGVDLFTTTALSQLRGPLLFGVAAGSLLLGVVLALYLCVVRHQRHHSEKAALIADEIHSAVVTRPPALVACRAIAPCSHAAPRV